MCKTEIIFEVSEDEAGGGYSASALVFVCQRRGIAPNLDALSRALPAPLFLRERTR